MRFLSNAPCFILFAVAEGEGACNYIGKVRFLVEVSFNSTICFPGLSLHQ